MEKEYCKSCNCGILLTRIKYSKILVRAETDFEYLNKNVKHTERIC